MKILTARSKNKFQKFLFKALDPIHEGLKKLYPSRELVVTDGLRRLHSLYFPAKHKGLWKGVKHSGREFPLPHGDAIHEWTYLEGEFARWDWREIKQEAQRAGKTIEQQNRFPQRDPAFPVTHRPLTRPKARRKYPRIDAIGGGWIWLDRFEKSIPRACWLLFVNDIPRELWANIIVIFVKHHFRLKLLSSNLQSLEELQKIETGMLNHKVGIDYLRTIRYLLPVPGLDNWKELRDSITLVIQGLDSSPYFRDDQCHINLKEKKQLLQREWKRLEGPAKRYRREASRYLRPLVSDVFGCINLGLQNAFDSAPHDYSDMEPKPRWLQTDVEEILGERINDNEIYRVVGDLLRFIYRWRDFKAFRGGIEPPDWSGDTLWRCVPEEARDEFTVIGKEWRGKFGKRIKNVHK